MIQNFCQVLNFSTWVNLKFFSHKCLGNLGIYFLQKTIRIAQIYFIFLKHSSNLKNTFSNLKISKDSHKEYKRTPVFLQSVFTVLQQFFDLLIRNQMSNQREIKISAHDFPKAEKSHLQADKYQLNFTQNSKLLNTSNINFDSLPSINSLFLKDNSVQYQNLPIFSRLHHRQNDNQLFYEDQSQIQMLAFGRGYSEQYQPEDKILMIEGDRLHNGQLGIDVMSTTIYESLKNCGTKGESAHIQSGQELQSNSINSQSNSNLVSPSEALCTGLMVKNVTKNIGKLLFKYIWKNRAALRKALQADESVWQQLMCMIRACKKQNNITREFLLSRFHSANDQCKLFRMLAHSFFRKHCLAAIFESKIKSKRIHFERIGKFKQALTNKGALDYLA